LKAPGVYTIMQVLGCLHWWDGSHSWRTHRDCITCNAQWWQNIQSTRVPLFHCSACTEAKFWNLWLSSKFICLTSLAHVKWRNTMACELHHA
jgi:hypothetical protein